jgi:hypothetical protein
MSLDLSKEMLTVEEYMADARLIVEDQLGKFIAPDIYAFVIEVARMLQIERQHNKKPRPKKAPEKVSVQCSRGDRLMSEARRNPQVPPMVSASDDEATQPKRSHTRKTPVVTKATLQRVVPRVRKSKAKTPAKPRRR